MYFYKCCDRNLPFKYLGLPEGTNPKRISTWEPLLEKLRRKLNSWTNRYISFGGCIVVLKAVQNSVPIFFLSYYLKMQVNVWKKIVKIQMGFHRERWKMV